MNTHAYPDKIEFITHLPTGGDVVQTLNHIHAINVSPAPGWVDIEFYCESHTVRMNGVDLPPTDPFCTVRVSGNWDDRLTYRIQPSESGPRRPRETGTYEEFVAHLLGFKTISSRGPRPKTEEEIRARGFTRGPRPMIP